MLTDEQIDETNAERVRMDNLPVEIDGSLVESKGHRIADMKLAIEEQTEISKMLLVYIQSNMTIDVDFGIIPGTQNPTLLQPGAQKICGLFKLFPKFVVTDKTIDLDKGFISYDYDCRLTTESSRVIQMGVGNANSWESKWRYRNANRKCPQCGKEAIIKGKEEYGGGWICFKKKDGCGAKFHDNDKSITEQEVGKIENDNPADLMNTIKKMAKKRSHVDAAAAICRQYGFNYTQDMEDVQANDQAAGRPTKANATPRPEDVRRTTPEQNARINQVKTEVPGMKTGTEVFGDAYEPSQPPGPDMLVERMLMLISQTPAKNWHGFLDNAHKQDKLMRLQRMSLPTDATTEECNLIIAKCEEWLDKLAKRRNANG